MTKRQRPSHTAGLTQLRKMKAKILKRLINEDGKQLEIGDIVDVSKWRNTKALVGSRYITFVTEEETKQETKSKVLKDAGTE